MLTIGLGAGVPHHPADHGAEPDGEHRVADLAPDAIRQDVRYLLQRYPLDQGDTYGDQEEGGEAVQSQLRHQKEQDEDADPDHDERHVSVLP
jgi:hypothetical protein